MKNTFSKLIKNKRALLVLSLTVIALISTQDLMFKPHYTEVETVNASFRFFDNEEDKFPENHKKSVIQIAENTISKMRILMPKLAPTINFNILMIKRDLSMVKGVTGRADKNDEIEISLSTIYEGGLEQAIKDGLEITLFHELHHAVRGWTMNDNQFDKGIDIAVINEGLADVFAEIQTGHSNSYYTDVVDYDAWTKEILALPKNAEYGEWMFLHPDGREAIGYRTGEYLIKKALSDSGKDILEISKLSVKEVYQLAGY